MDYNQKLKYLDLENSNILKCYQGHIKLKILSKSVFILFLQPAGQKRNLILIVTLTLNEKDTVGLSQSLNVTHTQITYMIEMTNLNLQIRIQRKISRRLICNDNRFILIIGQF